MRNFFSTSLQKLTCLLNFQVIVILLVSVTHTMRIKKRGQKHNLFCVSAIVKGLFSSLLNIACLILYILNLIEPLSFVIENQCWISNPKLTITFNHFTLFWENLLLYIILDYQIKHVKQNCTNLKNFSCRTIISSKRRNQYPNGNHGQKAPTQKISFLRKFFILKLRSTSVKTRIS